MRKLMKWTGIVLGGLAGLVAITAGILYASTSQRIAKRYDIQPEAVVVRTDAASIQRAQHLAEFNCVDCHGPDLSGRAFFFDPALGVINSANLTLGRGGAGAQFQDADWVLAIRHGVDDQGRTLMIMPSEALYYLSDADLGSIVGHIKTVPAVDREWPAPALTPMARILLAVGALGQIFPAETIPHAAPRPVAPPVGRTPAYGGYLMQILDCGACHGAQLSGGVDPDSAVSLAPDLNLIFPLDPSIDQLRRVDAEVPLAPDLTPWGQLGFWTEADFVRAVQTGITPSGRILSDSMPWKTFGRMTAEELGAIWLYLAIWLYM